METKVKKAIKLAQFDKVYDLHRRLEESVKDFEVAKDRLNFLRATSNIVISPNGFLWRECGKFWCLMNKSEKDEVIIGPGIGDPMIFEELKKGKKRNMIEIMVWQKRMENEAKYGKELQSMLAIAKLESIFVY